MSRAQVGLGIEIGKKIMEEENNRLRQQLMDASKSGGGFLPGLAGTLVGAAITVLAPVVIELIKEKLDQ